VALFGGAEGRASTGFAGVGALGDEEPSTPLDDDGVCDDLASSGDTPESVPFEVLGAARAPPDCVSFVFGEPHSESISSVDGGTDTADPGAPEPILPGGDDPLARLFG